MRWIYISPHIDDAIYSAGGLIYEQVQSGIPVEIWTVMSGIPEYGTLSSYAKAIHRFWGTRSARESMEIRRVENEKAVAFVGARLRYLDFIDSLYRVGSDGQPLYTNSFLPLNQGEQDLPQQLAETLATHLESTDILVCPLALGGHVDHIVARSAVDLLGLSPYFVADIPYVLDVPRTVWWKTLGMKKELHPISESGLGAWLQAIRAYGSQVELEFKTDELLEKKMTDYWNKHKGIWLWRKR